MKEIGEFLKGSEGNLFGTVDFNTLIPMPKPLEIEAGSRAERGFRAYREFMKAAETLEENEGKRLEKRYRDMFMDDPAVWELGKRYYENLRDYGAANWYDWSIGHWGTKWNAYDCARTEPEDRLLIFLTAWDGVPAIAKAVSKKFPDVTVFYAWADENIGYNVGRITLKNAGIVGADIPADGSREAYEMSAEIMDVELHDWGFELSEDGTAYEFREPEHAGVPENGQKDIPSGDAR